MIVFDATDLIVGRLCTKAAKAALLGEKVMIVNCEKAVLTGRKENTVARFKQNRDRGEPTHGPFVHRFPDRIVRRCVRGMLPMKKDRGQQAFKRVMCYIGVPDKLKNEKVETVEGANISKVPSLKYTTLLEVSRELGAKL